MKDRAHPSRNRILRRRMTRAAPGALQGRKGSPLPPRVQPSLPAPGAVPSFRRLRAYHQPRSNQATQRQFWGARIINPGCSSCREDDERRRRGNGESFGSGGLLRCNGVGRRRRPGRPSGSPTGIPGGLVVVERQKIRCRG